MIKLNLNQTIVSPLIIILMLFISACGTSSTALEDPTSETPPPVATNSAPSLSISSPSHLTKSDAESVNFNGTAQDEEDGDISSNIVWSSNIDGEVGQGNSITIFLSEGEHTVTASITDSASQTTSASIAVTITATVTENALPTITITAPSTGQNNAPGHTINFTATAADEEDGDISSSIVWSSNIDGEMGQGNSISVILSEGAHTVSASITDSASQTTNTSIAVTVSASTSENNIPTIIITSPSNNSNEIENTATTFIATANDNEDGDISANIQWTSSVDGELGVGAEVVATLSLGAHTITASITDSDDNSVNTTITYTVQVSFGTANVSWVAPTENTDGSQLTDLAGFKIYYGTSEQQLDNSVTIDSAETLSFLIENLSVNTTYFFTVIAFNSNGVESEFSDAASKFIQG